MCGEDYAFPTPFCVRPNTFRTFAHRTLACGSMVRSVDCVSFFRPAGRKNDTRRIEQHRQAKIL